MESNPILKEIETKETWGDGSLYKGLEEIISHGALSEHMREIKSNFINKYVNDRKDFLIRQILNNLQ